MRHIGSRSEAERIESCLKGAVKRSKAPELYRALVRTAESLGWPFRFGLPDERLMKEAGIRSQKTFRRDLSRLVRWRMIERVSDEEEGSKNRSPRYYLCPSEEVRIPTPIPGLRNQIGRPPRPAPKRDRSRAIQEIISSLEKNSSRRLDEACLDLLRFYLRQREVLSINEAGWFIQSAARYGLPRLKRAIIRNLRQQEYPWKTFWRMLTGVESIG